jgi:hypothetical protein
MRWTTREGIVSKVLTCSVFWASVAALGLAANQGVGTGPESWTDSPYRNFHAAQSILGGRVLVADETDDPPLLVALSRDLSLLQAQLHESQGWRQPLADGEALRIYVARKDAGGVRRLSIGSSDGGHLSRLAVQIDGTGLTDAEIEREAVRLYALATLTAYGAPDRSFLTAAAADYLSAGIVPVEDREEAQAAAAAPVLDLQAQADSLGGLYVDEYARSGGPVSLRLVWEKAAETGQEVLPLFLKSYSDATGETDDRLLLRFAARLYATLDPDATPSHIGLSDLQNGGLDASPPAPFVVRHWSYTPGLEAPGALRVSWPDVGGAAAAVVRYRDPAISSDVVFFSARDERTIPMPGVARVDWLVAGSASGAPANRVSALFESLSGYPYAGLVARATAGEEGPRVLWTTLSHQGLAGWAIFREEVLPDGRVARTGPEILPASDRGEQPLQYVFVDPGAAPGTFYRYTVWAVTDEGTLARAFAATLRTVD